MRWVLILDRDAWEEDARFWDLGKEGLQGGLHSEDRAGGRWALEPRCMGLVHGELTEHTPPPYLWSAPGEFGMSESSVGKNPRRVSVEG